MFFGLAVVLPILVTFSVVPIALTPLGRWLYFPASAAAAALVISAADRTGKRRRTFIAVLLALMSFVVIAATVVLTLERTFDGLVSTETVSQTPSPSGRLVLVHDYVDQGATGGDSVVYVRGHFIPALASWRYRVAVGDEIRAVKWVDDSTVSVNGDPMSVPWPVLWFGW